MATSGAASKVNENTFDNKDGFIKAAKKVELRTDFEDMNNVIKLRRIEQGFITLTKVKHELTLVVDHIIFKVMI